MGGVQNSLAMGLEGAFLKPFPHWATRKRSKMRTNSRMYQIFYFFGAVMHSYSPHRQGTPIGHPKVPGKWFRICPATLAAGIVRNHRGARGRFMHIHVHALPQMWEEPHTCRMFARLLRKHVFAHGLPCVLALAKHHKS